jgi:O-acetylhomoserine/O-acetylserine sulfhydrylase-like pyridoxal-dependent enzyme
VRFCCAPGAKGLRDFGASMSPHTAWLILQGLETLPLRMARHVENARKVVAFLAGHPGVASVGYPELESHPDHALAKRLLPRGCGSVFSFDLRGSREQGRAFIEALKLFSTSPTSATAARSSSIRPRRRISAWTTRRWRAPASARGRSASRSAWRTPTTCSTT